MKILAFANYKGGVGKTTISTNISAAIARQEKVVLHVDFDFQGNSSEALGVAPGSPGLSDFLQGQAELGQLIVSHQDGAMEGLGLPDLFVLPSGPDLEVFQADRGLPFKAGKPAGTLLQAVDRLRRGLEKLDAAATAQGKPISLVVLDTRPDFGWNTALALGVAEKVVVPVEAHQSSVSGLESLQRHIALVKDGLNPGLELMGAFINGFKKIDKSQLQVIVALKKMLGKKLFDTVITDSSHLAQGYATKTPAVHSYPDTPGAKCIRDLAKAISRELGLEE